MKPEVRKAIKVGALGIGANMAGTLGTLEAEYLLNTPHTSEGLAAGILTAIVIFALSYGAGHVAEEGAPRHRGMHIDVVGATNSIAIVGGAIATEFVGNILPSILITAVPLVLGYLSMRPRRDRKYYYDKD